MRAAAPRAQAAASPAAALAPSLRESVKLALSLAGCIIGTYALVYYGTLVDFNPRFVALWAAGGFLCLAALWRRFGALTVWAAVLLIQASLYCACAWNPSSFLPEAAAGLAAPTAAYLLCRALGWRSSVFALVLAAALGADLWRYAGRASVLYESQPSPASRGVDVSLAPTGWPASRSAAPPEWLDARHQPVRYPELVLRRAFAFAVPMTDAPVSFDGALRVDRWATFFLQKDYFRLIHSGLDPAILREFMAVDRPLFQFKIGAILVPDGRLPGFFAGLAPGRAAGLLRCYAVDQTGGGSTWAPFMASPETALNRSPGCRPPEFSLSFLARTSDELRADYRAGGSGVLYWSDGYDRRWRAFVDGGEVPIARSGEAFKALPLPAGSHRLRLAYEPRLFEVGLVLHYAALAACALAALTIGLWSRASRSR